LISFFFFFFATGGMGHTFSRPVEHNCVQILYGADKGHLSPPYPTHYNESDEEKTMLTWIKRLLLTASFLALITTNILTLTSVCDPELQDAIDVWGGVIENMDQWLESLVDSV
jgi:hypothetical protein